MSTLDNALDLGQGIYTKDEVDTSLSGIYTKSEIDNKPTGRKNLLINGDFKVWQRGTSSNLSGYLADRFRMNVYIQSVVSSRVVSGLDEFYYAYRISDNNALCDFEQRIEGINFPSGANEMTLSFWVRGSKTGTVKTGRITNAGSTNTGYGYVDVTTSWTRVSVTTTNQPSADPSQYCSVYILDEIRDYLSSSSDWLEITGVQLELGSVATPFEHRYYGEELALCQRYYFRRTFTATYQTVLQPCVVLGPNRVYGRIHYPVDMRVPPSFSHNGANNFRVNNGIHDENCIDIVSSHPAIDGTTVAFYKTTSNMTVGTAAYINTEATNDAWYAFDAEL
jgi:hypothetical protein